MFTRSVLATAALCMLVAQATVADDNPQLGDWVTNQRAFNRRGLLTTARTRRLESLGFDWDPHASAWEEMYAELQGFKEEYGHCKIPANWTENPQLYNWVKKQRQRKRNNKLSANHVRRLDALAVQRAPPTHT